MSLSSFYPKRLDWFEPEDFLKSINLSATVSCCFGFSSLDGGALGNTDIVEDFWTSWAENELVAWGAIGGALKALASGEVKAAT